MKAVKLHRSTASMVWFSICCVKPAKLIQQIDECQQKYGSPGVWKACCNVFDFLNLAAIIDGEILCVHGGLSPDIRTLDQIRVLSRAQEIPHEGAFCGWSS